MKALLFLPLQIDNESIVAVCDATMLSVEKKLAPKSN